ncbi:MAG: helix-turn-helix domain-containing protein [Planctomycetota bacterium]
MSKMFYTVSEAAAKLGMSDSDVKGLIDSGQLQEFRDGNEIMVKVDQVDLLSGGDDGGDDLIPLADSSELEPMGLSSSGSGSVFGVEDAGEQTGISIFDPEGEEEADPAAATQIAPASPGSAMSDSDFSATNYESGVSFADFGEDSAVDMEASGAGGGLLEDVYASGDSGAAADSGIGGSDVLDTGGDLFESAAETGEDADLVAAGQAPAMGVVAAEPYDGAGSGIFAGVAFGIVVALLIATTAVVLAMTGAGAAVFDGLSMTLVYAVSGGGLGIMLLGAAVGWFLLRKG